MNINIKNSHKYKYIETQVIYMPVPVHCLLSVLGCYERVKTEVEMSSRYSTSLNITENVFVLFLSTLYLV